MVDPKKSKDIPATQEMLYGVRGELKSDIASVKLEVRALEKRMNSRFDEVNSRFEKVDARFEEMNSKFDSLLSEVKDQNAKFHRMLTLFEEQESRNKYVLDGYTSLNDMG